MVDARQSTFEMDGERFVVDMSARGNRRPSDDEAFTIVKGAQYLPVYEQLANAYRPRTLLELGIFQGGSYVYLDKVFKPERMSAVEISEEPIEPLVAYTRRHERRSAHFGVSQSDGAVLERIVSEEFDGRLDMVIDDASHAYEHTLRSFEILFPLLEPGGVYIIEDWGWAHHPAYQGSGAPFEYRQSLTKLLFQQIMLLGSTTYISEIRVLKSMYIIRRSPVPGFPKGDFWETIRSRGRTLPFF